MVAAWKEHLQLGRVLRWAGLVVVLVVVILNSRRPELSEAAGSAVFPLIAFPVVDLVSQRRKGRSFPRSVGNALLSLVTVALLLTSFYALAMIFGRPRNVDPFSESLDPAATFLVVLIVLIFAWAEVARYFDLGPLARNRDL
jgi:hypothetical protein